jgi:group I intron endonuclease
VIMKKYKSGIYCIKLVTDGRVYIGSSSMLERRLDKHESMLSCGVHHSKKLQHAWNKYGEGAFEFSVLEYASGKEALISQEQHWIDTLNSFNNGFNIRPKADTCLGRRHTPETRALMSKVAKEKNRSPSAECIAASKLANIGRKKSPEETEKRKASLRGRVFSEETKRKISEANMGRRVSDEARANMSRSHLGKPNPNKGKPNLKSREFLLGRKPSEETRAKLRASSAKRWAKYHEEKEAA